MQIALLIGTVGALGIASNPDGAAGTMGVLPSWWLPGVPSVAIPPEYNAREPVVLRSDFGTLIIAAEGRGAEGSSLLVVRSNDDGHTWDAPRKISRPASGNRISAGAGGSLPDGIIVLAFHEWNETPGQVTHTHEAPAGVHHYSWSGFRRESALKVLVSEDDGETWTHAATNTGSGPTAASAMGKIFQANGSAWFPVYGPADLDEMDAALNGVGLMRSDDVGDSWRFSHWVARADTQRGIGYGPGDVTVLPDGRWLGTLQGNDRRRGDYTRPRICRTISTDDGAAWSVPEQGFLNHGCSTVALDNNEIMLGGWKDRGIMFTVGADAGANWLYQGEVWWCIWYGKGDRGETRLIKSDDGVLVAYHWMDKDDPSRTEVRTQLVRRASKERSRKRTGVGNKAPKWKWVMAEAHQVPDIAAAPAGIRIKTLLKLQSGDWICVGYVGSKKSEAAYGFAPTGLCILRSPEIVGPWKRVADLPTPPEVGSLFDTGTGAGMPGVMVRHSSGRLFLPLSTKDRKDIILTYSDDEGRTWETIGAMANITGLPAVHEADKIVERKDGSLILPMQRPFHAATNRHPLFYVRSNDRGETWSDPTFWATHPGTRYEGLPQGPLGDLRETSIAVVGEKNWIGIYRESRGAPVVEDVYNGPLSMPYLCLSRGIDDGKSWRSSFGFLGVEPDIATLPGGAVMVAYRDDNLASVWLSYDQGNSWRIQVDPAELPWRSKAAEAHGQWPPGGEPVIRVLDDDTAVVICDTGTIPSGKLIPEDYKWSKEFKGRVQVRFFRRAPAE
jgi:hypothetical protein